MLCTTTFCNNHNTSISRPEDPLYCYVLKQYINRNLVQEKNKCFISTRQPLFINHIIANTFFYIILA